MTVPERRLRRLAPPAEARETFPCFGSTCTVIVSGSGSMGSAAEAVARGKRALLDWNRRFSRFEPASELSRLNRYPRRTVRVSKSIAQFVRAALECARFTDGLVDPTMVGELERVGYAETFPSDSLPLRVGLTHAPPRRPARAHPAGRWRQIEVDPRMPCVRRPVGLQLDSGGVVKGMSGDWLATVLSGHGSFAVDAAGDLSFGGRENLARPVRVASPFDGSILHVFELRAGAAATSGIGKRSWLDERGRPAHHLLDPATGRPAFTGIVQVTALAPRGLEAEARAKAALLSGPGEARRWLRHGGVIAYDDGRSEVIAPADAVAR